MPPRGMYPPRTRSAAVMRTPGRFPLPKERPARGTFYRPAGAQDPHFRIWAACVGVSAVREDEYWEIFQETDGHCHYCGDRLRFDNRWVVGKSEGFPTHAAGRYSPAFPDSTHQGLTNLASLTPSLQSATGLHSVSCGFGCSRELPMKAGRCSRTPTCCSATCSC